jgi:hypothetical protein
MHAKHAILIEKKRQCEKLKIQINREFHRPVVSH